MAKNRNKSSKTGRSTNKNAPMVDCPQPEGKENSCIVLQFPAHLLKVRTGRIIISPLLSAREVDQMLPSIMKRLSMDGWVGIAQEAKDAGARAYAIYETPPDISIKVDESLKTDVRTRHGFADITIAENIKLKIQIKRSDIVSIPPRGPKLVCLSVLGLGDSDEAYFCHQVVLEATTSEAQSTAETNPATGSATTGAGLETPESQTTRAPGPESRAAQQPALAHDSCVDGNGNPSCETDSNTASSATTADFIVLEIKNVSSYKQLKILSIFPYGRFRVLQSGYGEFGKTVRENMISYLSAERAPGGASNNSPSVSGNELVYNKDDMASEDVMDTDRIIGFGKIYQRSMGAVGGNNIVVVERGTEAGVIVGFRTFYERSNTHGLVFPSNGYFHDSEPAGLGEYIHSIVWRVKGLSDSRKRILSAYSWMEGPADSFTTADNKHMFSWGITHWTSIGGHKLIGSELSNAMSFLYAEHRSAFERVFHQYGLSVWYDASHRVEYGPKRAEGHLPFKDSVILFPGCHGSNVDLSLRALKEARWLNGRSIYAAWVFRMAGMDPEIQVGQVEWLNHRINVAIADAIEHHPDQTLREGLKNPSEWDVARALLWHVNKADPLDREGRITGKSGWATINGKILDTTAGSFEASPKNPK